MTVGSWLGAPVGTKMIGGPWNDGALPPGRPLLVHVLAGRDSTGMAIAACGLRQEHRSNGWALIVNDYQRAKIASGEWPPCMKCNLNKKERTMDPDETTYEVTVSNTFEASGPEDAVRQMIEWLIDNAPMTGYRVQPADNTDPLHVLFIDGDDV